MSDRPQPLRLWVIAVAAGLAVAVVFMIWLDRPIADRVNALMTHQPTVLDWTARLLGSLTIVAKTALLVLLWWGVHALRRRPLAAWAATPLLCCSSLFGALVVSVWLKLLIGRSQVYPPWIERREYGFRPFHGLREYGAFPSATMAAAAAVLSVIWIRAPRRRGWCVAAGTLVALGIILTNGHWASDVIGGALLGAFSGWLTVQRLAAVAIPASASG